MSKLSLCMLLAVSALVWGRDPVPMNLTHGPIVNGRIVGPPGLVTGRPIPPAGFPPRVEPGPVIKKTLSCSPPTSKNGVILVGTKYTMECSIQNLRPGKTRVSTCTLFSAPVRPNAKKTKIELIRALEINPDAKFANFSSKMQPGYSVRVEQDTQKASVVDNRTETHFTCK